MSCKTNSEESWSLPVVSKLFHQAPTVALINRDEQRVRHLFWRKTHFVDAWSPREHDFQLWEIYADVIAALRCFGTAELKMFPRAHRRLGVFRDNVPVSTPAEHTFISLRKRIFHAHHSASILATSGLETLRNVVPERIRNAPFRGVTEELEHIEKFRALFY